MVDQPVERLTPGEEHPYYLVQEHVNRYLFAAKHAKAKTAIDLGCGSGYGSFVLANMGAARVVAVDISSITLEFAKQHYKRSKIDWVRADVARLPFRRRSSEVTVSFETIEHLNAHVEFVAECHRTLKSSGTLILSTPNKEIFSPASAKSDNPHHVHEFFVGELEFFLGQFFRRITLHGQTPNEMLEEGNEPDARLCPMPLNTAEYRFDSKYEVLPFRQDCRMIVVLCRSPKQNRRNPASLKSELDLIHFRELSRVFEAVVRSKATEPARDPMSALLRLYYTRKDLQKAFPEVVSGDYHNLLNWSRATVEQRADVSYNALTDFQHWYRTNRISELASLDQRIKDLTCEISSVRDALSRRIQDLSSELSSTRGTLSKSEEEKEELSKRIQDLLTSESWRLTEPLRRVYSFLFALGKRGQVLPSVPHTRSAAWSDVIPSDGLALCTIAAKNYLAHVRVLTDSFLKYHPSSKVFVLLVDEVDGYFEPRAEKFHLVRLEDLGVERLGPPFRFKYSVLELATAVKPFFLEYLLKAYSLRKIVYLDPDILVMHSLDSLFSDLDHFSIVVTPHLLEPLSDDRRPSELDILLAGTYNLGFLAIANTETARSFLNWWKERVYEYCTMEPLKGIHVDQKWVELALGYFDGIHILHHPGYNVAYWNMGTRHFTLENGQARVNGRPLYFFHFSGFDPDNIEQVSKHQNRFTLRDVPDYRALFETYKGLLYSQKYQDVKQCPYKYNRFDNGTPIPELARRIYRESNELQRKYADPFSTSQPDSYFDWLNSSVESPPKIPCVTRLWYEAYKQRKDVQEAHQDIFGRHRGGFIGWVTTTGWREYNVGKAFIPKDYFNASALSWRGHVFQRNRIAFGELVAITGRNLEVIRQQGLKSFLRQARIKLRMREFRIVRHVSALDWHHAPSLTKMGSAVEAKAGQQKDSSMITTQHRLDFGVNLTGYFTGQFGVAESSRAFARALKLAGVPFVLNNLVAKIHGERGAKEAEFSRDNPFAINLIHVNADQAERIFRSRPHAYHEGRTNIGIWYWELSTFPARWLSALELYTEIWATSSFTLEALSKISPVPVVKIRYPLFVNTSIIKTAPRLRYGFRDDLFIFMFAFDFLSVVERKNPFGLLKAFEQAFGRDEKALLVLYYINGSVNPVAVKMIKSAASRLNLRIIDSHLSLPDYMSLLAASDCYVSLHRSEGLGLIMAQAMNLGKPVIATAYSGNMDFMNLNNSLLVKYDLVELDRDYGPYEKGKVWAEPDVGHAAELMRWVQENRGETKRIGGRAAIDIKETLNPALAGREIRERLEWMFSSLKSGAI